MSATLKTKIKSSLTKEQLNLLRSIQSLRNLAYYDIRVNMLGQILPMKPTFISMMANDVCNSRCQMCLIWKQKKDHELSPQELESILADPFFSNVRHIGVTGGEPTLRKDLPELFKVICSRKAKVDGASIITNAIIEDVVKERVSTCAKVCREHNVGFGVMVSLDGLGEVHDTVRGRKNNFNSAINTINYFREQGIPASFGCTISNSNALYVDELLDYAISEGLYGRFRIAEFIQRLYNDELSENIRSFDDKTAYHLGLFFHRLQHSGFEKVPAHLKTYRSIQAMLTEGKPRQTGCPYHAQGVILTARGELLYCSPKSPILGNTLQTSPSKIYYSNLAKRREMIKKDCDNCIHDYHVPPNFREKVSFYLEHKRRHRKYNCSTLVTQAQKLKTANKITADLASVSSKKALIVGWYGTETAGDKAILWTIVNRLRSRSNPPKEIYLASLVPFICHWTVKEMELGEITVVETYSREFEQVCDQADEIIVGGGPLMDIEALNHMLYALIRGAKSGAINRVEGCGIGPLVDPLLTQVVREMLRLAHHVTLRDRASVNRSQKEFKILDVQAVPDPAVEYVEFVKSQGQLLKKTPPLGDTNNVSCFLREWGRDYAGNLEEVEYYSIKQAFESQLVQMIAYIAQLQNTEKVDFLPMHTFSLGGDDRILNRRLAKDISVLFEDNNQVSKVSFARGPVSPLEILQSMYHAKFNICMRFHSVLFAETLGVPYLAIDYTGGGKIKAFLESKGKLNQLISLRDVAEGKWKTPLENLLTPQLVD